MAVTECVYSRVQPASSVDERNLATYKVAYDITTNTVMGPRDVAIGCSDPSLGHTRTVPKLWTGYAYQPDPSVVAETDAISRARSYSFNQDPADKYRWYCEVNYTPLEPGEREEDNAENPVNRPARYTVDREVYTEIVEKDIEGNQIVNKAGAMYDEPLEQESTRGVLVIQKNVATLVEVMEYIAKFSGAVNSKSWNPFPGGSDVYSCSARRVLCRDVSAGDLQTEGDYSFYSVTFRLAFKAKGEAGKPDETWDREILERGYRYKWSKEAKLDSDDSLVDAPPDSDPVDPPPQDPEPGSEPNAVDPPPASTGRMVDSGSEPVLLAEDGTKLPDGEAGIFTSWRTRREVDFSGIPIKTIQSE